MVSLASRREMARYLQEAHLVSERRACEVVSICRSSKRREPSRRDAELIKRLIELSEKHSRFGYRKIWKLLVKEGFCVSRERVRLIRKTEGLRIAPKKRKQKPRRGTSSGLPTRAAYRNHVWTYDFMHDQTTDGKRLRFLTVIDEYTKEGLLIEAGRSLTSGDVLRVLKELFSIFGEPEFLRSDNGSEFTAHQVTDWLEKETGVKTLFINPGCPWENGMGESFNNIFRDGCLNRWLFDSVQQAKDESDVWLQEYNHVRPHGALGLLTPKEFIELTTQSKTMAA